MTRTKKITITYMFPGTFFAETLTEEVDNSDIPKTIPEDCYGFYFEETEYVVNGKEKFVGKTKQLGKTYLIGEAIHVSKIPSIDRGSDTKILKRNIENNSPTKTAIKCHTGNWQLEDETHVCLPASRFKLGKSRLYDNWGKK